MDSVIWKCIAGYEGYYEVNNAGQVRSVARTITAKGRPKRLESCTMKPAESKTGYLTVPLSMANERESKYVHRLVATAFLENPLNKPEVNHKNGIKKDNRLCNLEWVTAKENSIHSSRVIKTKFSLYVSGERHPNSRLTDQQRAQIRAEYNKGNTQRALSLIYGVSDSTIGRIVTTTTE
jgi:hypothetical protein